MRLAITTPIALALVLSCYPIAPLLAEEIQEPELRGELLALAQADQEARRPLIEDAKAGRQPAVETVFALFELDAVHTTRIKEIVEQYGWPGKTLVGEDGASAAFLLIQHADRSPEVQQAALPLLEQAWRAGEASGQDYALLTDRLLRAQGEPQIYGTQADLEHGEIVFAPIADSTLVDSRRAELGLPSLEEYRKMLEKEYTNIGID